MGLSSWRGAAFKAISQRFFFGWVIVAVAGVGIFASGPGQSHLFGVFAEPIANDLGFSRTAVASAYGVATLVAAFLLPMVGRFLDMYGPRRLLLWVSVLLGLACVLFGGVGGIVSLMLGLGVTRILGQGSLMMGSANLVAQWFNKRRGFAMGLMSIGFAASLAFHPPLAIWLIGEYGWRVAWVCLGLLTWLILLPPVLMFVYDKPEPLDLQVDGGAQSGAASKHLPQGISLREALRGNTLYILSIARFTTSVLLTSLHFHQMAILGAQGVAPAVATKFYPMAAVAMLVAMPLIGRLFDSVRTRYVIAGNLCLLAACMVMVTFVHDMTDAVIYSIMFGITNACTMTMFGFVMPRYFGRKHLGELQGVAQLTAVLGSSLGPVPIGLAFDRLGDPTQVIHMMAIAPVLCAFMVVFFLRTPAGVDYQAQLE